MSMLSLCKKLYDQERLFVLMLAFIVCVQALTFLGGNEAKPHQELQIENLEQKDIENILRENTGVRVFYAGLLLFAIAGFLMGIILLGVMLWRIKRGKSTVSQLQYHEDSRWNPLDVIKGVILYVFLGYALSIVTQLLVGLTGKETVLTQDWFHAVISLILDIGIVWFVLYIVKSKYRQNMRHLGLALKKKTMALIYGCGGYVMFIPILFITMLLSYALVNTLNIQIDPHPIVPMFLDETSLSVLIFLSFLACVIGPICEEIFFRGFAYPALKRQCGVFWAMVIVSFCFALIHASVYALIPIFTLGLLLVYLYEKTGSLIVPITVHVLHNSVMMLLVIFYKMLYGLTSEGSAL